MKVKLVDPPEGFSEDAEFRPAKSGEWADFGSRSGKPDIMQAGTDTGSSFLVLTKLPEPKPVLKPWYAEIAQVDHWFRLKSQPCGVYRPLAFDQGGISFRSDIGYCTWKQLGDAWEHIYNPFYPGEWEPCGYMGNPPDPDVPL